MDQSRPFVRVHVVAIDDDRRMLLERDQQSGAWDLPSTQMVGAQDPGGLASDLVRVTGAIPEMPRVVGVTSSLEQGTPYLDLTFQCGARRHWRATRTPSPALWWSLDELSTLDLSPRVRSALVHVWEQLWADPAVSLSR